MADEAGTGIGAGAAAGAAAVAAKKVWGQSFFEQAAAGVGGGGAGGGFKFPSTDEIDTVIAKWKEELRKILDDGDAIDSLVDAVVPPGKDMSSENYVNAARGSLKTLQEQNDSMREYAERYIEKLEAAKRAYQGQDAEGESTFSRFGKSVDGS